MNSVLKFLNEFEQLLDTNQKVYSLHLKGIHLILSSILLEREQTTPSEILEAFYEELNRPEWRSAVGG